MKKYLRSILSLVLIIYLVFASKISAHLADNEVCREMRIEVNDTSSSPFVTAKELARELKGLPTRAVGMKMKDIDTDSIRNILSRIDKIEDVQVVRTSQAEIIITVTPMRPVARIFDDDYSYYINREGKRMSADARYYMDVPVIMGHFDDKVMPTTTLIPLLDYLAANEKWGTIVSMIKVKGPGDVLLIPSIKGQVINFGDLDERTFDSKFKRLDRLYSEVIPKKGWNYYDTISVKWNNQIVASRRDKSYDDNKYVVNIDETTEADMGSMLAGDGVAPGQALAGRKAKDEKPLPASNRQSADTTGSRKAAPPEKAPAKPDAKTKDSKENKPTVKDSKEKAKDSKAPKDSKEKAKDSKEKTKDSKASKDSKSPKEKSKDTSKTTKKK